jgi:hypothetical protein
MLCYLSPGMVEALLEWFSRWPRLGVARRGWNFPQLVVVDLLPFDSFGGQLRAWWDRLYRAFIARQGSRRSVSECP